MKFFSKILSTGSQDAGAIYDPISGGQSIPLDAEEEEAIQQEIAKDKEGVDNVLGMVADEARYTQNVVDAMYNQDVIASAATALIDLAYTRYQGGQYKAAANSCVRAGGFAAQEKRGLAREQEPELWHLLARIHATVGRFDTAGRFLDSAERRMRQVGPKNLPHVLREGWNEGVRSLRTDIKMGRWPAPAGTVYYKTVKWLEAAPDIS